MRSPRGGITQIRASARVEYQNSKSNARAILIVALSGHRANMSLVSLRVAAARFVLANAAGEDGLLLDPISLAPLPARVCVLGKRAYDPRTLSDWFHGGNHTDPMTREHVFIKTRMTSTAQPEHTRWRLASIFSQCGTSLRAPLLWTGATP